METQTSADRYVSALAEVHRVLLLGGMAVIAHGLDRKTKDVDVWLEPMSSSQAWAEAVAHAASLFTGSQFWSLARHCDLPPSDLAAEVESFGVLRLSGFDRDIDVFRKPNELELEDFEPVWSRSSPLKDGTRLPSEIDLHMTKANTNRGRDWQDQFFLESLVKKRFQERLPVCDFEEARGMLDRFMDPQVLGYALENPHTEVRELALRHLHEFETEGDPYSRDILAAWRKRQGDEAP